MEGKNNFNVNYLKELSDFDFLKEKVLSSYVENGKINDEYNFKMVDFSEKLKSKYPDYEKHALFHRLIGGTPPDGCNKFDFLGEDSVVKFFLDMEK